MSAARIIVGVSGGVDSSVCALLLKQQGESIAGLFMQNWDEDGSGEAQGRASVAEGRTPRATGCRAEDDRRDALGVCGRLGITFHARNFAKEYWSEVFEHFLAEYRAGRTPNPDVLCNREIKFKAFLDEAWRLGAEKIATGHYAQVALRAGSLRLLRGADHDKDQSYFLHQLGQDALAATEFPIGHLQKQEVRRLAREAGLPTAEKKDSTGICFIGERDFREFLGQYIPARAGEIRSVDGEAVGEHSGVFFYTLGQREGLHIGGIKGRPAAPWFVVGKDVAANVLIVDQGGDSQWLLSNQLESEPAHWVAGRPPASSFRCSAKTRYRQDDQACMVTVKDDGSVDVRFDLAQRAVTPGQSVVFYQNDECLGGAVILHTDARLERLQRSQAA
jgi:tRNA-specific 2-thiouridylase